MPLPAAEFALPEAAPSRRQFDRAARSFASASFLHDETRRRLLERLDGLRVGAGPCVDLGAAIGRGAAELAARFAGRPVVALDASRAMLAQAVAGPFARVAGDATRLPFPDRSIGLVFANLLLPWTRPEALFAEARRVLAPDGLLLFSTLGPDTLGEIRRAWHKADDAIHVHAFWDVQTLGDLAVRAGLEEPVLDVDRLRISYQELSGLVRDLRATGSTNTAGGRRRGLTGRGHWSAFVDALWRDQGEGRHGRLNLTVELIFGQAFGSRAASRPGPAGEVVVPLDSLGRRRGQDA